MIMKEKKAWATPELTILVRSKPEEAVLGFCKLQSGAKTGPGTNVTSCVTYNEDDHCGTTFCANWTNS